MRCGVLGLVTVVGCGSSTTLEDASPPSGGHALVGLVSGGLEQPAIAPGAYLAFPETEFACQSDEIVDGCRVRRVCNPVSARPFYSAGAITFSTSPTTTLPPGQTSGSASELVANETIEISAAGSDVPPFDTSLVVPAQATITSRFDQTPPPVGEDLTITWIGPNAGVVEVYGFSGIDGDFGFINCALDASNGSGTISRAAIDRAGGGLLRFSNSSSATITIGAWTIEVSVGFDAIWPDRTYAQAIAPP